MVRAEEEMLVSVNDMPSARRNHEKGKRIQIFIIGSLLYLLIEPQEYREGS